MLALAADHIILDAAEFRATCLAGRAAAEAGSIVTFGIKPTEPKTSYGYILPGDAIGKDGVHKVKRFVEKPDAATAARYRARRLSVEFGEFPVPRRRAARRTRTARAGDGGGD